MKNTLQTITLALVVTCLSSCKKEYTCHCDTVTGGDQHVHVEATSNKKAQAACNDVANANGYKACDPG